MKKYGSRAEVWHGNAEMTTGKLTKSNLVKNKHGRIVSKRKKQMSSNPKHNPLLKKGLLAKRRSKTFGPNKNENENKNENKKNTYTNKSKKKCNNIVSCVKEFFKL